MAVGICTGIIKHDWRTFLLRTCMDSYKTCCSEQWTPVYMWYSIQYMIRWKTVGRPHRSPHLFPLMGRLWNLKGRLWHSSLHEGTLEYLNCYIKTLEAIFMLSFIAHVLTHISELMPWTCTRGFKHVNIWWRQNYLKKNFMTCSPKPRAKLRQKKKQIRKLCVTKCLVLVGHVTTSELIV